GDNILTFSHSLALQADIILGNEAPFAGVSGFSRDTDVMDGDKITGQHVLMQLLNQSGVSGFLNTPGATTPGIVHTLNNNGNGNIHVDHVTLNNMTFTTAFPVFTTQLGVRVDDGDYYFDRPDGFLIE